MIHLEEGRRSGVPSVPFGYLGRIGLLGRLVLPITRALRISRVLRRLPAAGSHLDFGCDDGYLLLRSPCRDRFGYDPQMGDSPSDLKAFPDGTFDCVTMVSVIEYLEDPLPALAELRRLLKPDGVFILTTPRLAAVHLRRLYAWERDEGRKRYYDSASLRALADGLFTIAWMETFNLGTNQLFVLKPAARAP